MRDYLRTEVEGGYTQITEEHEATLWGPGNAYYLDCGTGFTGIYTCDPVLHFKYV